MDNLHHKICIGTLILLFSGCSPSTSTSAHNVQKRLESSVAAGATSFDFADDPTFTWDRMFIFDAYTPQSVVEKSLGFKWPDFNKSSIGSSDGICLVLFVQAGKVTDWYEQPRTIELRHLANGKGYAPTEAKFKIIRTGTRPELHP